MNPETLLNQAAEAMEKRGVTLTGYYHVAFVHNRIECIPTDSPDIGLIQFATFSENNLRDGLTTRQWDELSRKIIRFYEKETVRCQHPKH